MSTGDGSSTWNPTTSRHSLARPSRSLARPQSELSISTEGVACRSPTYSTPGYCSLATTSRCSFPVAASSSTRQFSTTARSKPRAGTSLPTLRRRLPMQLEAVRSTVGTIGVCLASAAASWPTSANSCSRQKTPDHNSSPEAGSRLPCHVASGSPRASRLHGNRCVWRPDVPDNTAVLIVLPSAQLDCDELVSVERWTQLEAEVLEELSLVNRDDHLAIVLLGEHSNKPGELRNVDLIHRLDGVVEH